MTISQMKELLLIAHSWLYEFQTHLNNGKLKIIRFWLCAKEHSKRFTLIIHSKL